MTAATPQVQSTFLDAYEDDHITNCLETGSFYEERMLKDMAARADGGLYVDVGSHIGNHVLYMIYHGLCDTAWCFEPHPTNFDLLSKNIQQNNIPPSNCRLFNKGVWAYDTAAHIYMPQSSNPNTGMYQLRIDPLGPVECMPLDAICYSVRNRIAWIKDNQGEIPNTVVKIDAEGAADRVIEGMEIFAKDIKPILYIEIGKPHEWYRISTMLANLGYAPQKRFNHTPTICFAHKSDASNYKNTFPFVTYEELIAL
jgi:FkbM family methyltransferase